MFGIELNFWCSSVQWNQISSNILTMKLARTGSSVAVWRRLDFRNVFPRSIFAPSPAGRKITPASTNLYEQFPGRLLHDG